jgi:hypothetical protein
VEIPWTSSAFARDVRFRSVEAASSPAIYLLAGEDAQAPRFSSTLLVRTTLPPGVAISTITRTIRESTVPMTITETRALIEIVRAVTSTTRFVATLLVGFAIGAALLAGLGIYGVIAYIVTQRTREFGVRLMLGADGRTLLGGIVRHGAGLVLGGAAIGVVVAGRRGAPYRVAALRRRVVRRRHVRGRDQYRGCDRAAVDVHSGSPHLEHRPSRRAPNIA